MNIIVPQQNSNQIMQDFKIKIWKYFRLSNFFVDLSNYLFYGTSIPEEKLLISYKPLAMSSDFSKIQGGSMTKNSLFDVDENSGPKNKFFLVEEFAGIKSDIDGIFKFMKDLRYLTSRGGLSKNVVSNILGKVAGIRGLQRTQTFGEVNTKTSKSKFII